MSDDTSLVEQIKEASALIAQSDARMHERLGGIEGSVNELFRRTGRPGAFGGDLGATDERKSATEMCRIKHALDVPKIETTEYVPSSAQVDAALAAKRGLKALIRHGDMNKLDSMERKSLSAFVRSNSLLTTPAWLVARGHVRRHVSPTTRSLTCRKGLGSLKLKRKQSAWSFVRLLIC